MFIDPLYLILTLPGLALAMWAQWRVKSTFGHYSTVPIQRGLTGADIAKAILRVRGIHDVTVEPVEGFLADHYDPTQKALRLSPDVYHGRSVAAAGVAAHEVGHAIQHAEAYRWLAMRSALVPVLNVTNRTAMPLIFLGFILMSFGSLGLGQLAFQVGALLFAVTVLFQLITLPVEFDASKRALVAIQTGGIVTGEEHIGARKVLNAAALTYVAAAVTSILTLLYFLIRTGVIGGRDE